MLFGMAITTIIILGITLEVATLLGVILLRTMESLDLILMNIQTHRWYPEEMSNMFDEFDDEFGGNNWGNGSNFNNPYMNNFNNPYNNFNGNPNQINNPYFKNQNIK
jgi:hypothetical protein